MRRPCRRPGLGAVVVWALMLGLTSACGAAPSSGQGNGVQSLSAAQVLDDVRAALGRLHSFHLDAHYVDNYGDNAVSGDFVMPDQLDIQVSAAGHGTVSVRVTGGRFYAKGDSAFYGASGAMPDSAVDHWARVPDMFAVYLVGLGPMAEPDHVADCFIPWQHGSVTKGAVETIGGREALVLEASGSGGAKGRVWVSTTGEPLPLRLTESGPTLGSRSCGIAFGNTTPRSTDATLSAFDGRSSVDAPEGAIDLSTLAPTTSGSARTPPGQAMAALPVTTAPEAGR